MRRAGGTRDTILLVTPFTPPASARAGGRTAVGLIGVHLWFPLGTLLEPRMNTDEHRYAARGPRGWTGGAVPSRCGLTREEGSCQRLGHAGRAVGSQTSRACTRRVRRIVGMVAAGAPSSINARVQVPAGLCCRWHVRPSVRQRAKQGRSSTRGRPGDALRILFTRTTHGRLPC